MVNWYLVIDLEMCRVPKGARTKSYPWASEIIQIGAVLLSSNYKVVDKKSIYVKPQYGKLTRDIEKLTGIEQSQVYGEPYIQEAFEELVSWLPEGKIEVVTWSDSDYNQIAHELEGKDIHNSIIEELFNNYTDCQKIFGKRLGYERPYKLSEALVAAGIIAEGREHDGLDDAYNTAILFSKLKTEHNLILNPIFEEARKEEVQHLNYSIGSVFRELNLEARTA